MAEVEHLVEHDVAETLDLGNPVADLADDANGLLGGRGFGARDLGFYLLDQVSHLSSPHRDNRAHKRASIAASFARTLPSYTSLPTLMRIPPMSPGFCANDVSSPGP